MSDGTHIEWTDASWTPFRAWGNEREALGWGCEKVSEGCQHCYAETINRRLGTGLPYSVKAVERSGGQHYLDENALLKPLSWKKPRRIFVSSMTDIFGDWVPFEWLDRVFAVMALTPQHTYQVLTKRPERMREYVQRHSDFPLAGTLNDLFSFAQMLGLESVPKAAFAAWTGWPLPNVWLGTSTENQHWLDIRVPELLATPAAVRFLSCEPLLGPVDLRPWLTRVPTSGDGWRLTGGVALGIADIVLDWVIVGGESGPGARPFDLTWARSIVSQCRAAGVAVFVKQLGRFAFDSAAFSHYTGDTPLERFRRDLDQSVGVKHPKGGNPDEWAEDLRVREWPV